MTDIVDLFEYRERREGETVVYVWKCGNCEGQEWLILDNSGLECANCGHILDSITHNGGE